MEALCNESDVIYFHMENSVLLLSLRSVIYNHVQSVKLEELILPFLQNIYWAANRLKKRIVHSLRGEKNKRKLVQVKSGETPFQILSSVNEASDLITTFIEQTNHPQESDVTGLYRFLFKHFLLSSETRALLLEILKESLENFTSRLINAFMNANWSSLQDAPSDLIDLVDMLCRTRVQQYCANTAPSYLLHVLDMGKHRNPFRQAEKKRWSSANTEERKELCHEFLRVLLSRTEVSLMKETRDKQYKKSHFHLIHQLKIVLKELLAVRSFNGAHQICLKSMHEKGQAITKFCRNSIRKINPHPRLDVQANLPLPEKMVDAREDSILPQSSHEKIIKEISEHLLRPHEGGNHIQRLERMLKFKYRGLELTQSQNVDKRLLTLALLNVLGDKDHFDIELDPSLVLDHNDAEVKRLLTLARKLLFAHQKSSVFCKVVSEQSLPGNEIHLRKSLLEENCLEVLISSEMSEKVDAIRKEFKDRSQHLAPIFVPTTRPGPTPDIQGNYFLEEDPWSKGLLLDDSSEEKIEREGEVKQHDEQRSGLCLNIFLVVEPQHLSTVHTTINGLQHSTISDMNLTYVVLPQSGRGIGVTRAIIKILAECINFSLYWTIDDDIQFMYQFDASDRRWRKCSFTKGLLFGQRVFQTCLEKNVRELSNEERFHLYKEVTKNWPSFALHTAASSCALLIDEESFVEIQKNPSLLHTPFENIPKDSVGDAVKEEMLKAYERDYVKECRKRIFKDTVNQIAGVSLSHESTKRFDYMSKYPTADYMRSEQRYKVVLHNGCALEGRNFVTDEMIFRDQEFQVCDEEKRCTPYYGIRGNETSFCRALTVSGVIGYQVIRIVYSRKKLVDGDDLRCKKGSFLPLSQSPHRSEDKDACNSL